MNRNIKESSIPILINKLVKCLSEDVPDVASELEETALHFLAHSAQDTLSSNTDSVESIVKRMRDHVERNFNEDLCKFDSLIKKLNDKTLTNRAAILELLENLMKLPDTVCASPAVANWDVSNHIDEISGDESNSDERKLDIFSSHIKFCSTPVSSLFGSSRLINRVSNSTASESSSTQVTPSVPVTPSSSQELLSERDLVHEMMFAFQGIEGNVLRKEPGTGGFIIDTRIGIEKSQRALVLHLAELGFLLNQVKCYCSNLDNSVGSIGMCFVTALQAELSEYYRTVAELQSTVDSASADHVSLRQLLVWARKPMSRMLLLADLTTECHLKKGGALISSVFMFMWHGAPDFKLTARRILKKITTPLLQLLTRWMLDGMLEDSCSEFFIECRPVSTSEQLWHDKYHLRENMIPGFITPHQAKQILVTGKSINFLRDVCNDLTNIVGKDTIQRTFEHMNAEALFVPELNTEFRGALDRAYRSTAHRVLDVMRDDFNLIRHIQAFRRFLLLGQGDFTQILMNQLALELCKPASTIYTHTLTAILDNAVRSSNAVYENEDILRRLDVRLMEVSEGDFGWDVFTMLYHVDGPIGTLFEPTLECYRILFTALWKAKRMEYVLSSMWKRQTTSAKAFRALPETSSIMQAIHILTSEMVHFIKEIQYYFLFEVLECSWIEMLDTLNGAQTLDDIIVAHDKFLNGVQYGVLLGPDSQALYMQLCTIYNTILKLESVEENMHYMLHYELKQINEFGEEKSSAKLKTFLQALKAQVRSVAKQYNDYIRKFLHMLASHTDISLQLLSVRLDFNMYYERTSSAEFTGSFSRQ